MDIFDACDALSGTADTVNSSGAETWTDRLNSITLPQLPEAITETYLRRLIPLYVRLGTANPVRDVLCNIAVQQSTYRIMPWTEGGAGLFIQCGGMGSSVFPATVICNWRLKCLFNLSWLAPECDSQANGEGRLIQALADLKEQGLTGETMLGQVPFHELPSALSLGNLYERSTLHIAGLPSDILADYAAETIADRIADDAITLFSGLRPVIHRLAAVLRQRFPNKHTRLVDTVTLSEGQPDRPEALLIIRSFTPEALPGTPYLVGYERLRESAPVMEAAELTTLDWSNTTSAGYVSLEGSDFTTSSTNLGVLGTGRLRSRYHDIALDDPWKCAGPAGSRYRRSFGRVGSFPNGCLIDRFPMTADGRIPLDAIMPYYLGPDETPVWLGTGGMPDLPVAELPGTWLALPDVGPPLSHWMLENFLPLLALKELGVEFNLMLSQPPSNYQRTYLELAGFPRERLYIAKRSTIHRCGRLLVPFRDEGQHILNSYARLHHPASRDGIEALMRRLDDAPRERSNRLYVSRMDARDYRACLNEEEVSAFFLSKGFQIVNGKQLTPTQALTVYGNARIIFGPLGAGILNAVFAPPDCQIRSFGAPSYHEEFVEQIANLIGHDHGHLACDYFRSPDTWEGGVRNSNFVADIRLLSDMLDEAEARAELLVTG